MYYELKASIKKHPVLGNGNEWWESSEERLECLLLSFDASPSSGLGGACAVRCHLWGAMRCPKRGFSWEVSDDASRVLEGLPSGWVSPGLTLSDSGLSSTAVPSWALVPRPGSARAGTKTSFFRLFLCLCISAPAHGTCTVNIRGCLAHQGVQKEGPVWGSGAQLPKLGSQVGPCESKVGIFLPSPKTPGHPSCPRGSGEGLGSAEQGYFHPSHSLIHSPQI